MLTGGLIAACAASVNDDTIGGDGNILDAAVADTSDGSHHNYGNDSSSDTGGGQTQDGSVADTSTGHDGSVADTSTGHDASPVPDSSTGDPDTSTGGGVMCPSDTAHTLTAAAALLAGAPTCTTGDDCTTAGDCCDAAFGVCIPL